MTNQEALKKISKLDSNLRVDCEKNIGETLFERLCLIGIIRQGVGIQNDEPVRTFAITDFGQEQIDFFNSKPTDEEKSIGDFCEKRGWTL
ncbi:MAG: hypothetical protein LBO74_03115 [Candidatus Symbiothrix sp.]|jgi:hypothetical protein|nr:hypothetical protein [Candidatus Symbiothrix sp.]